LSFFAAPFGHWLWGGGGSAHECGGVTMGTAMTIDERLERLTERHEAVAQSIEVLTHDISELRATVEIYAQNIRALARVAEIHERRRTELEN